MSKQARPGNAAQRRLAEVQRQQRRRQLRGRALAGGVIVAVAVAAAILIIALRPGGAPAVKGAATGAPVDGVSCATSEQTAYHIHAHLAIFVNGRPSPVPADIGIPGQCLYWLHTHDTTGVIHVESPAARVYTLGTFFDIWGRPLSAGQVGSATGTVTAFVNGKRYPGDPRSIRLQPHTVIQLDVGTVVAPRPYTFSPGL